MPRKKATNRSAHRRLFSIALGLAISLLVVGTALAAFGWLSTERVSVSSAGLEGNDDSGGSGLPDFSANGRYVVFESDASNLVATDTNGQTDIFLHDRVTGTTELISVNLAGTDSGDNISVWPTISNDGRYVAFESRASDLVASDGNGVRDCFVRDRVSGTTKRISVDTGGNDANGNSEHCRISGNGNFVAFGSFATDLIPVDANGSSPDIFVRDLVNDTTTIANVNNSGNQVDGVDSEFFDISDNGRFVVFDSTANNVVTPDTYAFNQDAYVRDLSLNTTERVSVDENGDQVDESINEVYISGNGRYVSWYTGTGYVTPDTNGAKDDIYVHDRNTGETFIVSVDSNGVQGNSDAFGGLFSSDGRYIVFTTDSSNLDSGDSNGAYDLYVHDLQTGETIRASFAYDGSEPNDDVAFRVNISGDGSAVVATSPATNLVANDTNGDIDVFVFELALPAEAASSAESGPTINKNIAASGVTTLGSGRILVRVPASAIPSGETNCRISVTQKGDSGEYGFELDDTVWDVKIICDSGEINILFGAIDVCIRPKDGVVGDKQVFHRHGGGVFNPLPSTGAVTGYVCGQTRTLSLFTLGLVGLPDTGFEPGGVELPAQPEALVYSSTEIVLTIPELGVESSIVGVPQGPNGWDVSWLGDSAGYLVGTAFPTLPGNTVITAHVWGADNQPGPFAELESLQHGDRFGIEAWGATYTYEVRSNALYSPDSLRPLAHEDYDWVTLVTCQGFDEDSGEYAFRRVVRAILVEVH